MPAKVRHCQLPNLPSISAQLKTFLRAHPLATNVASMKLSSAISSVLYRQLCSGVSSGLLYRPVYFFKLCSALCLLTRARVDTHATTYHYPRGRITRPLLSQRSQTVHVPQLHRIISTLNAAAYVWQRRLIFMHYSTVSVPSGMIRSQCNSCLGKRGVLNNTHYHSTLCS